MESPLLLDVSLYEFALCAEAAPLTLQLSPTTFKSVVASFIDLLSEQKLPAIVWAKLPKGEVWLSELDRYLIADAAKSIYLFKSHRDDADTGMSSTIATLGSGRLIDSENFPAVRASVTSIQLAPESPLRREYFLLVWSPEFRGAVLAQRTTPSRVSGLPQALAPSRSNSASRLGSATESTGDSADETAERKPLLRTLCSLNTELLEQLLQRLEQGLAQSVATIDKDAVARDPVADWTQRLAEMPSAAIEVRVLEQILTKQIQKQDEIWQRNAGYRRQAELVESLQLQNEELLSAVRLKDEFLNHVGQELRTPLTTIKTALKLLSSPNLKSAQRQRYMDLIDKECDRQSALITSLLELVQIDQMAEQVTMQPLQLSDVVPGVVSTYQPLAEEKGIMLAYTVPEDLPQVACVNAWLKQIVIHLLHNGIKFTPRGGQVWVRAKRQGDYVQLEFRDTGIGIPQAEIPKIFDRFYRVRQSAEEVSGAGLGLTIVQQLILHCSGSISVRSKFGEGSTFNVMLPIYKLPEALISQL
jgi:signal transduction histidine kinase